MKQLESSFDHLMDRGRGDDVDVMIAKLRHQLGDDQATVWDPAVAGESQAVGAWEGTRGPKAAALAFALALAIAVPFLLMRGGEVSSPAIEPDAAVTTTVEQTDVVPDSTTLPGSGGSSTTVVSPIAQQSTTPTTMIVVVEEPMSDADILDVLAASDPSNVRGDLQNLTSLTVGQVPPPLVGEYLLSDSNGADGKPFVWAELAGRPTLIYMWDRVATLENSYREGDTSLLNLSAFQETFDALGSDFNFVSVIDRRSAQTAVAVMQRDQRTFPLVVTAELGSWTWPEGDAWLLFDADGRFVNWFFAWGTARSGTAAWALPVNFLLENLGDGYVVGRPIPDATVGTGLATDCVGSLATDADGGLWSVSPCGISRFDGRSWRAMDVDPGFLKDATTLEMAASPDGSVWFISDHVPTGVRSVAQYVDGTWTYLPGLPGFQSITVDADGRPWVAKEDRLVRLEDGAWVTQLTTGPDTSDVASVAVAPDGSIWVSREARLDRFDGKRWMSYDNGVGGPGEVGHQPAGPSPWIEVGPDGTVWLADLASGGLLSFDGEAFSAHAIATQILAPVAFAPDGTVWAVTDSGPHRFDGKTWIQVSVAGDLDPVLTAVAVTPDGRVWFGTPDSGIFEYDR